MTETCVQVVCRERVFHCHMFMLSARYSRVAIKVSFTQLLTFSLEMAFLGMAFTLVGAPDQLTALATRFAPLLHFSGMPQIEIELLQIKTTQIQSQGHF